MGLTRLWCTGALLATALLVDDPALAADPAAEAKERFERAIKLYEDQDYAAALAELERAAKLKPSHKLFYNIGQVHVAMRDYAAAIAAYRQYLDQGAQRITADRRDLVHKEIQRLEQRVAKLAITTDVPGAEISVDDRLVGVTPLAEPVLANAGTRRVTIRHPSYPTQSRTLSLAGRVQESLSFSLAESATMTPQPAATPPSTGDQSLRGPTARTGPASPEGDQASVPDRKVLIGWVATGALATGAVVTGVLALNGNADLADQRERPSRAEDLNSDASRVRTLAIATDALAVAAVAVGAVTLWWTLSSDSPEAAAPAAAMPRGPRIGVGMGPLGASFGGRF